MSDIDLQKTSQAPQPRKLSTEKRPSVKTIRALSRGVQVLRLLQNSGGMSLNDLHRVTGLPKATLLRILVTLEGEGMIWQRIVDNAYLASHVLQKSLTRAEEEIRLAELASPLLEKMTQTIRWPSILAVPRLTHMEVIEATAPRSYFHHIELGPVGFQVNMLLSATGRAYLAFCPTEERDATLDRLRHSMRSGDKMARDSKWVGEIISMTRQRGYAVRDPRFGGNFDLTRRHYDDGRDSLAVPVFNGRRVAACINITWIRRVTSQADIVAKYLGEVKTIARTLGQQISGESGSGS
ncbi:transcriptional regulator [Zhengella mangrovi]|uniref:Transcriptional regulator n=1 Tax=Zhengella mangrovi TaxID=1982044 RepID=A0A2G1QR35_9HYPH|nr:helix-turn-helix domain-containing protein [Zhengella mangrovi]PHP67920.1 transcriptional regulator [Zhengella mangrovi]